MLGIFSKQINISVPKFTEYFLFFRNENFHFEPKLIEVILKKVTLKAYRGWFKVAKYTQRLRTDTLFHLLRIHHGS